MFHDMRREEDSLGTMDLPRTCLWGIHTQRALENFPVSGIPLQHFPEFIRALAWVRAQEVHLIFTMRSYELS